MASEEHLVLSDFIKSVHEDLRRNTKLFGHENAWKIHCGDSEKLRKYAEAMQELATNHWEDSCKKGDKAMSRVEWIHDYAIKYFFDKEMERQRCRERDIASKIDLELPPDLSAEQESTLKVLDVGSCYNPFKVYKDFDVVAIDIAPACEDVLKCDFLHDKLERIQFDMVIFCLVLEYLPDPLQRLSFCEKAYDLLRTEGILVIVTPDSKHVGANAPIMKSWRFVLAKIGFSRIKYEKLPYLHCMVFRKSLRKEVAQRWVDLQKAQPKHDEIVIPQDFNNYESKNVVPK